MKNIFTIILFIISSHLYAGNCNYPDDIAADGSRCGGRAASVRPGGRLDAHDAPIPFTWPIELYTSSIISKKIDKNLVLSSSHPLATWAIVTYRNDGSIFSVQDFAEYSNNTKAREYVVGFANGLLLSGQAKSNVAFTFDTVKNIINDEANLLPHIGEKYNMIPLEDLIGEGIMKKYRNADTTIIIPPVNSFQSIGSILLEQYNGNYYERNYKTILDQYENLVGIANSFVVTGHVCAKEFFNTEQIHMMLKNEYRIGQPIDSKSKYTYNTYAWFVLLHSIQRNYPCDN